MLPRGSSHIENNSVIHRLSRGQEFCSSADSHPVPQNYKTTHLKTSQSRELQECEMRTQFPRQAAVQHNFSPALQYTSEKGSISPPTLILQVYTHHKKKNFFLDIFTRTSKFVSNEQVCLKLLKDLTNLPKLYTKAPHAAVCEILNILQCLKTTVVAKDS